MVSNQAAIRLRSEQSAGAGPHDSRPSPFLTPARDCKIEPQRLRSARSARGVRCGCVMVRHVGVRTAADPIAAAVMAIVLGLSFPASVLAQTAAVPAAFLIVAGQGIGSIRLGMTLEQVRAALGPEERMVPDPVTHATVVAWKTTAGGRFGVWFRDGRAVNIAVNHDARYATAQGLRDGDAAETVRQLLGAPLETGSVPSNSLGMLLVFRYPGLLVYIPNGAKDPTLDGKVYSILVAVSDAQGAAPPPAQSSAPAPPTPAQSATATQVPTQPARPTPAPPAPSTTAGAQPARPDLTRPSPGAPPVIVPGRSIGAVRLGMTLAQVTKLFGPATGTQPSPGGGVTHWWLDPSRREGFGVQLTRGNRVDRLLLMNDASYATSTGLHVGSMEADIRAALGAPASVSVDAKSQRATFRYDTLGIWFEIELDRQSPRLGTVVAVDVVAPVAAGTTPADRGPSPLPLPDRP